MSVSIVWQRSRLSATFLCLVLIPASRALGDSPADFVITNASILTVDDHFSRAEALAVRGEYILAVGSNSDVAPNVGAGTRVIDAHGKMVLPGLCDSHTHSYRASVSELNGTQPVLKSLNEAFQYIREKAASQSPGSWILLERVYPTRLQEGRLPTLAELDAAAPDNPVYWNCGPVSMANTRAMQVSHITRDTPDPLPGQIVRDATGAPTGLLRNAAQLLKFAASGHQPTAAQQREALKHLYHLYNQQGITSICERRTEFDAIDLFRELEASGELTVRINCTRLMEPVPRDLETALKKLDEMVTGPDGHGHYGPTGVGDDWVRMGPFKVFLDGGVLIGTAYMREPWGVGDTYQITDPSYRGLLNVKPELLNALYLAAAQRGWRLTAHCTGEAAVDLLLDCYENIQKQMEIRPRRFEICHANFQSAKNFDICKHLGIVADMQPAWLYKDGASLLKTLGPRRMKWFEPLESWFDNGLIIAGGSDHMIGLDSLASTNPWNPWLGMWIALTRHMEQGGILNPPECLTREQAVCFYTINGARLNFDEDKKGSLKSGKYADLIMVDRDLLQCPVDDVRGTKVLLTMVDGKVVWETP